MRPTINYFRDPVFVLTQFKGLFEDLEKNVLHNSYRDLFSAEIAFIFFLTSGEILYNNTLVFLMEYPKKNYVILFRIEIKIKYN